MDSDVILKDNIEIASGFPERMQLGVSFLSEPGTKASPCSPGSPRDGCLGRVKGFRARSMHHDSVFLISGLGIHDLNLADPKVDPTTVPLEPTF